MFKKFFGKKNDGFYMQVDESAPPKAAVAPKEVVADAPKAEDAKADAPKAAEVTAKSEVVSKASAEQKSKSAKTSIKKDKNQEKKKDEPAKTEVAVVAPVIPTITNFATDYLVTPAIAGNRRRPGANMKGFVSMARDVKEMKKGSQGNQQKQKAAKKTEA